MGSRSKRFVASGSGVCVGFSNAQYTYTRRQLPIISTWRSLSVKLESYRAGLLGIQKKIDDAIKTTNDAAEDCKSLAWEARLKQGKAAVVGGITTVLTAGVITVSTLVGGPVGLVGGVSSWRWRYWQHCDYCDRIWLFSKGFQSTVHNLKWFGQLCQSIERLLLKFIMHLINLQL